MNQPVSITRDLSLNLHLAASTSSCSSLVSREVLAVPAGKGVELVVLGSDQQPLASVVLDLDPSAIADTTGIPAAQLQQAAWLSDVRRVAGPAGERAQSLALYAALQRARLADRHQLGVTAVDDSTPLSRLLGLAAIAGQPVIQAPGR